jgi:hypothetical protein
LIALFSPPAKESVGEKIELPASSSEVLSFEPPVKSTEPASKIATIDAAEQKNVSAEHAIDDSLTMAVTSLTPVKRNEKRAAKKEAKLLAKRQAQQHAQQHANHSLNQQLGQQSDQPPAPASISAKANPGAKSATPGSQSAADDPPLGLLFAIFIALVSSGTIMVLEVAGTRLMMLLLGSSTYSLSCVLFSAFLAFALSAQFIQRPQGSHSAFTIDFSARHLWRHVARAMATVISCNLATLLDANFFKCIRVVCAASPDHLLCHLCATVSRTRRHISDSARFHASAPRQFR